MSNDHETGHLTASDKESGKAVYGAENRKIGKIESVMIDKTSGEIAYDYGTSGYYGSYGYSSGYYGGYANRSYVTGRPTLFPRYYGGGWNW